jgi:hypothetical protein
MISTFQSVRWRLEREAAQVLRRLGAGIIKRADGWTGHATVGKADQGQVMVSDGPSKQNRPKGRTPLEFLDGEGKLLPAENELLRACAFGEPAVIGTERPSQMTPQNHIRSAFLRFLVLGGDDTVPIHEKGVHVAGAWIDGHIDLEACRATTPVVPKNRIRTDSRDETESAHPPRRCLRSSICLGRLS